MGSESIAHEAEVRMGERARGREGERARGREGERARGIIVLVKSN